MMMMMAVSAGQQCCTACRAASLPLSASPPNEGFSSPAGCVLLTALLLFFFLHDNVDSLIIEELTLLVKQFKRQSCLLLWARQRKMHIYIYLCVCVRENHNMHSISSLDILCKLCPGVYN